MGTRVRRRGFTLVELLVVIAIIGILVALLLPAIQAAREAARRNACINNIRQLGVAVHNHHDAKKRMPLASSEAFGNTVGSTTAPRAGYSWVVALLPFMEEQQIYDRIAFISDKFVKGAFAATITQSQDATAYHVCALQNQALKCPSYGGPEETPNPPYLRTGPVGLEKNAAVGNYTCLVSSFVTAMKKIPLVHTEGGLAGNGTMPFPETARNVSNGLNFKAMIDGMSKTILLTETKEERFSNWYCGQSAWVVGAWSDSMTQPQPEGAAATAADGFLGWGAVALANNVNRTALNVGGIEGGTQIYYWSGTFVGGGQPREWGPSSNHTGSIVVSLFGDAHVIGINSNDIDKNLYLRMISRNGGEPITLPE